MTPEEIAKLPYRPCVGVMLMNAGGEIFVGQRRDRYTEAWQMPQGGVDKGEHPRDAALRELWEETGVTADLVEIVAETEEWLPYDLPHDLVPNIWKGRYRGQKQKWFLMRFQNFQTGDGKRRISWWRISCRLNARFTCKCWITSPPISRPHKGSGKHRNVWAGVPRQHT